MNGGASRKNPRAAVLRVGGASEIVAALRDFGVDPGDVLNAAGIHPAQFDDPGNLITYAARDQLMAQCVASTGCQHFGLLVGERMDVSALGIVGMLAKTAPDAGTALRDLVAFLHLHSQAATLSLATEDQLSVLSYYWSGSGLVATDQTGDGAVAMMLNVMRALCGPGFRPAGASFAHRRPENVAPFREFFNTSLYFDAPRFSLMFSQKWLDARPPAADVELHRMLKTAVDAIANTHSLEFPDQVRKVLRSALLAGHGSESQVAAIFAMRPHTFTRRLKDFDTNFRDLIDECRFEIAQEMLKSTSLGVGEIGEVLGYSRASSFIRSFRRWSGSSPARWRAACTDN